ncbi:ImpA family metalloprotease [Motilimonas sp. E26]|uniref:ImpA family metalloprotease n=1 Tax=Motilimonas sp. E26 TaxID=2865674 RepID=UPI001E5AE5B0|nr:ImpA family metalloprotease [Motilimonas sp. E26]MCE0555871.1 ImpA family metalloprotease [Motilimonas sp. E26]
MALNYTGKILALTGALLGLTACGGGSGGSDTGNSSDGGAGGQPSIIPSSVPSIAPSSSPSPSPNIIPSAAPSTEPTLQVAITTRVSTGGQITPAQLQVSQGESVSVSVQASSGYQLLNIQGCGGQLSAMQYQFNAVQNCQIQAEFISNPELALQRGDHRLASETELISFAQQQITELRQVQQSLLAQIYQGAIVPTARNSQEVAAVNDTQIAQAITAPLTWNPSHDSITFNVVDPSQSTIVLRANQNGGGDPSQAGLIVAGEQNGHRYSAMAANLFAVNTNAETDQLLKNLLTWLTARDLSSGQLKVITSHVPSNADSWYFPHNERIRSWLDTHFADRYQINAANTCDYEALLDCINQLQPDLIILSDIDREERGNTALEPAIELAKRNKIPLLVANYRRQASAMSADLYRYMALHTSGNYWSKHQVVNALPSEQMAADADLTKVATLFTKYGQGQVASDSVTGCNTNYINCGDATFSAEFKNAADWLRSGAIAVDDWGLDVFNGTSASSYRVLKTALLLADKYRQQIDYPITLAQPKAFSEALLADWLVSYARAKNAAQPDLGQFVVDKSQVQQGSNSHYAYPATAEQTLWVEVPYQGQWTTTGWYALPGQTISLTRLDSNSANVKIKLNYHRANTNRVFSGANYYSPLELEQSRLSLAAGETTTFSSPYGGPIYLYINGGEAPYRVNVKAQGISFHPAILDPSDDAQVARFTQLMLNTEIPHVDLRTEGAEQHMRRDKFLGASSVDADAVTTLLKSVQEDHIGAVYTLAGFKVQGKTLAESLSTNVLASCTGLFGRDACVDASLHTRQLIQHANYDQNAHCGAGCSGNPWDASWNISPTGWGDNHELGHNLQTNKLNVQYAAAADRNDWGQYGSRAGENSNNIFPYFVKWRAHYQRDLQTSIITDGHMNHKDLFYVFMSDALALKNSQGDRVVLGSRCSALDSGDRFEGPWASNAYATHNGYRMAFYIQLALQNHKAVLSDGSQLENGFHLFTLMYQYSRIFADAARDQASWDAQKASLGFAQFTYSGDATYGGRNVSSIPGNDFMLVALSYLTAKNWQPYFDMFGLRYSDLAASQAVANATKGSVTPGMYVLETDLPPVNMSEGLDFIALDLANPTARWPRDNSSPADCGL